MEVFKGLHAFIWRDNRENNCNAYVISGNKNILIDPGHLHLFGHVKKGLDALQIKPEVIDVVIVTHGHPDHLEGVGQFKHPTLWAMNEKEYQFIHKLAGHYFQIPEPDFFLDEGDLFIGEHRFQVTITPGHSPASICLYWPDRKVLFTGDVIFPQGIGRTDLPGGSGKLLKKSILKIAALDVEYLLSGHGEMVVGKAAVQKNFQMVQDMWFRYI